MGMKFRFCRLKRPEGGWPHNSENALQALKMAEMVNFMLCVSPQLNT